MSRFVVGLTGGVASGKSALAARDGVDLALANRMIDAQASRRERLAIADDIVANDGPIGHLDEVARELDALYRTLAAVGAA